MSKNKYIIKVNDKEYHSYKEMCVDLDIDYKDFIKMKHENHGISEVDLLSHFFDEVLIRMTDSSYFVR